MTELIFERKHAVKAIGKAKTKGLDWLYERYPAPNGQMRRAQTGFLMYEGARYPVKALGRLANKIAGSSTTGAHHTRTFQTYFKNYGFRLIDSPDGKAETADERQRCLAEVLTRPNQAKFRREVFKQFGARCLITGCESLVTLEAAHVEPVSTGGSDKAWNGIPLRADMHRLFDAGMIKIESGGWKLNVDEDVREDYGHYHDMDLRPALSKIDSASKLALAEALRRRRIDH